MATEGPPPFSRIAGQLSASTWTYAALGALVETGSLERIEERRTPTEIASETRIDVLLVEALLDVAFALGIVSRSDDGYQANADVLAMLKSPAGRAQRLFVRSDFLQITDLIRRARDGSLKPGWHYTDPDILNAQGIGSGAVMEALCREVVPKASACQRQGQSSWTSALASPGSVSRSRGCGRICES